MTAFAHNWESSEGKAFRLGVGLVRGECDALCLCERERKRHDGFPTQARRDSFVMGRQAAKLALRAYGNCDAPHEIEIANDLEGAPYCERLPVNITLSHCGGAAIAMVSHRAMRVGVDLEPLDAFGSLSERWFDKGEIELVRYSPALDGMSMDVRRGLLWVSREALGKALGTGLAVDWTMLSVARIERALSGWEATFRNIPRFKANIWRIDGLMAACAFPSSVSVSSPSTWRERLAAAFSDQQPTGRK